MVGVGNGGQLNSILGLCWDQTGGGSWVGWRPEVTETGERCMGAETGGQGGDQGEDCE